VSLALYRKYRSKSLDEIIGQGHITDILAKSIKQGKFSHAYLLTGPRGVGKTSVARILAREINKLEYNEESGHLDIIEIDGASNNGVEHIRELREKALIAPAMAQKKIYIIDEVHMLSSSAFNALLKTLEEPPEHVVFILATTDLHKVPATIISRTQRYTFRLVPIDEIKKHLKYIADKESINISDEALELIAEYGDGSFRDSISLLDQLSNLAGKNSGITPVMIEESLGIAPKKLVNSFYDALNKNDISEITKLIGDASKQGVDFVSLSKQLITKLVEDAPNNPSNLSLIDKLLEVSSSNYPNLKLLSVIGTFIASRSDEIVTHNKKPKISLLEVSKKQPEIKSSEIQLNSKPKSKVKTSKTVLKLDWQTLVEYIKSNHIALYSVIARCSHDVTDDELVLYCSNNFYKKKLDDAKYRLLLNKSLSKCGIGTMNITTVPSSKPIEDSKIASIADIMGGGEIVEI